MKTYLIYGAVMTFASAVLTLVMQILGLFTPEHLGTAMLVGMICGIAIMVVCLILGTKADRATVGPGAYGYGRALKAGIMITLAAACVGIVFNLIYFKFINPNMGETVAQWTQSFMERMGAPESQIEKKVADIRESSTVMRQVFRGFLNTAITGAILSLITSAFLKRAAAEPPLSAS